jgi:hypothetical protein
MWPKRPLKIRPQRAEFVGLLDKAAQLKAQERCIVKKKLFYDLI